MRIELPGLIEELKNTKMKKVKLNTLLDNAAFKISANSKVWYFVVQKNKGDIIYQAKISGLTFHSKKSKLKKVFAL